MQPKDFKSYDEALAYITRVADEGQEADHPLARDVLLSLEASRLVATCMAMTDPRVPKDRAKDVLNEAINSFALQAGLVHLNRMHGIAQEAGVCMDAVLPTYCDDSIKEIEDADQRQKLILLALIEEFMPEKMPKKEA